MKPKHIITEFVLTLSSALNHVSCPVVNLGVHCANEILKQHNTLQQALIHFLYIVLKHYSKYATVDLRNSQAAKWAKEATSITTDFSVI